MQLSHAWDQTCHCLSATASTEMATPMLRCARQTSSSACIIFECCCTGRMSNPCLLQSSWWLDIQMARPNHTPEPRWPSSHQMRQLCPQCLPQGSSVLPPVLYSACPIRPLHLGAHPPRPSPASQTLEIVDRQPAQSNALTVLSWQRHTP